MEYASNLQAQVLCDDILFPVNQGSAHHLVKWKLHAMI